MSHGRNMVCSDVFNAVKDFDVKTVKKGGRFPEEKNIEFYIEYGNTWYRLLVIKIFEGRPPFYKKWIEVFSIVPEISFDDKVFVFYNTDIEKNLIKCLSSSIGAGERLFIEYIYDKETWKALEIGVPPHLTRIGFMLLENGFTWFKDWYYPEGFMEGNPKLQAEKPINDEVKQEHVKNLCRETALFTEKIKAFIESNIHREIFENMYKRIEKILNSLCRKI